MLPIVVDELVKHYRVPTRAPGLGAALKAVFSRTYKEVKAVDGVTFSIKPGERVGFLGPNGAGKTTTLKMMAGLLVPTRGKVRVGEFTPHERRHEYLRSIMLVAGQKNQLIWDLPPADTFELNRAIYDVPQALFKTRLDELTTLLELGDLVQKPARQLSLGERMKCELAAALLHGPQVLFLDEPTIGLDVTMQATVRNFIKSYNQKYGATILLTSHYMDDVAALCDRILIIDHGKLRYDGPLDKLIQQTKPEKRLTLKLGSPASEAVLQSLGKIIVHTPASVVLQVEQQHLQTAVQQAMRDLSVMDLTVENAPLEEVLADVFAGRAL